jgi:cytoskeleton protein RodZ
MSPKPDPLKGFRTDLTVGDILRRARLKKKLTIQDIEVAIRVSSQHITAIEENRLEMLPGRIYALGFIKSYAEHVDLDSAKVLELLKRQAGEKIAPKNAAPAPSPILEDFSLPSGKMFGVIFVLFIVLFIFKSHYEGSAYLMKEQIPKVPKDLIVQTTLLSKPEKIEPKVEAKVDTPNTAAKSLAEFIAPPPVTNQVVLKALDNVWLEIRDANRVTVFSRVLSVGEEYWIPVGQNDLTMTLGNAGGLQISVDGQALPLLGKTGQVIRKVSLDVEKLKQGLKIPPKPAM